MLPAFVEVYNRYERIVLREHATTMSGFRGLRCEEHLGTVERLLEAYAHAWRAVEDKDVVTTPIWPRRFGASTFCVAMMKSMPDARMVSETLRLAKDASNRLCNVFAEETKWMMPLVPSPGRCHQSMLWMSDAYVRLIANPRPALVIFDADTVYEHERRADNAYRIRDALGCGVLLFGGRRPRISIL